jgi:hypothetical protein
MNWFKLQSYDIRAIIFLNSWGKGPGSRWGEWNCEFLAIRIPKSIVGVKEEKSAEVCFGPDDSGRGRRSRRRAAV